MDPRLLGYYNDELAHLREMGAEFAREFPKVAARLGMDGLDVADPYVERLMEAFAFVSARIQLKIDAEFPRFTQHLLEIVYPHYLAPTPACAIAELAPRFDDPALADGVVVPRGSLLRAARARDEATPCTFSTAHALTMWPIELADARWFQYAPDLPLAAFTRPAVRGGLRLRLRCTAGLTFRQLACDTLTLHLKAPTDTAMRLYERLLASGLGAIMVEPGGTAPVDRLGATAVTAAGFADDESLLPYDARAFQGYRLLHEYFAFPTRYLFIRVSGLNRALRRMRGSECELVLLSSAADAELEAAIDREAVSLYSTPVANLFPRRADRVFLTDAQFEHQLVVDRARPLDFEVFSITGVTGLGAGADDVRFLPFYAGFDEHGGSAHPAFYTVRREPRLLSSRQRRQGSRSSYAGTEVFLSLVDAREAPYPLALEQLAVEVLATNRDLPLLLPVGSANRLTFDSTVPVTSVTMTAGPSRPRAGFVDGDTAWRLLAHLSLNYLSLFETERGSAAAAVRDLLALYIDDADASGRRQVDAVRGLQARPVIRRLPLAGPIVFGRGLEVTLTLEEAGFAGAGAYLFASVFERFVARHVSINAFTETVLVSDRRGEVARWPARSGIRPIA